MVLRANRHIYRLCLNCKESVSQDVGQTKMLNRKPFWFVIIVHCHGRKYAFLTETSQTVKAGTMKQTRGIDKDTNINIDNKGRRERRY